MEKFAELFHEYREEHGILEARKMAQKECIRDLMDDLCEEELDAEEKIDKIIWVLELMNMKVN